MRTYSAEPTSNSENEGETTKQYLYKVHLTLEEFGTLKMSGDSVAILLLINGKQVQGILKLGLTITNLTGVTVIYRRTSP
ncbi:hypothetical protein [Deinococcus altitudinis]|uniref:hypothetical protein n=1 Tax=Deinococcus altitudinis TaxID=468914 RepID=UPI00389299F3